MQLTKCVPRVRPNEDDDLSECISLQEASSFIGRRLVTLYRWLDWYHDDRYEKPVDIPSLPDVLQEGPRKPLLFRKSDLTKLIRFRQYIQRERPMGEYNNRFLSKSQRAKLKPETWAKKKPPRYVPAEIYYARLAEEAKQARLARQAGIEKSSNSDE